MSQTPWDDLSREDLLMEVRRLHFALASARSVLGASKRTSSDEHPSLAGTYWGRNGTGGGALAMADAALGDVG